MSAREKGLIRKRPVTFGNPALGTYQGTVYTAEGHTRTNPIIEGAVSVERIVAMVDVPPEQVPEGVLNLFRSHRPWISHIRIVIADGDSENLSLVTQASSLSVTNAAESAAPILLAKSQEERDEIVLSGYHYRFSNRVYLVLIELCSKEATDLIVQDLHSQPYTSLDETQVCQMYHVVALRGEDGVSLMSVFFAPSTTPSKNGKLEILPSDSNESVEQEDHLNCAVCLEYMELHSRASERASVLTTVCNHSFHIDCFLPMQDSPCPVCRYDHSGLNETLSQCHVCGTTENNYVCLICGVISCGGGGIRRQNMTPNSASSSAPTDRFSSASHARDHYDETLHAYALDTETQHVWDFAGGGYVHRLLQNKDDGKLVEISDPNNTTSQERSLSPGLSEAQEDEVVHRKLEGFATQYYTLLKSQLEQQRIYYEGRLQEIRRGYETTNAHRKTTDLITALKQERNQLSHRLVTLEHKSRKTKEDVAFLISMNESLEANKEPLRRQIAEAQQERLNTQHVFDESLAALEENVTKLMLQLESESHETDSKPPGR